MFNAYRSSVFLAYQQRKDQGLLSVNLSNPTPARLRDECMIVINERYSEKDAGTLRQFFGPYAKGSDYLHMVAMADIDRFRPLVNFLQGRTAETDPRNVELLAWLMGFEPRPYLNSSAPSNEGGQTPETVQTPVLQEEDADGVFISYSWDTTEHEAKVLAFTDHLRKNGFHARLDKMLTQRETSINFVKMMHKAMLEHPKVIVVLSEGFKQKAENFTGGVGEEYQLLINDINNSPKKYILVSFQGRSNAIVPFGLQGRNIIDLSTDGAEEMLFRKLMDQDPYVFSPVGKEKPKLSPLEIDEFTPAEKIFPIGIEEPSVVRGDSSSKGGLYTSLEFQLILNFKNLSGTSVDGFAYEVKVLQQLMPGSYGQPAVDGHFVLSESVSQKVFPKQTVKSSPYQIKITSNAKYQVIGSEISVTVYTDQGDQTRVFQVNELFRTSPANQGYVEKSPLTMEIFF